VEPTAVYTVAALRAFGLRPSTVRREVGEGRLRVSRRAGRYYVLGAWLREWLEGGEVHRQPDARAPRPSGGECASGGAPRPSAPHPYP
jgi:hypothetical protein